MSEICTICGRDGLARETAVPLTNGYRHKECPRLEEGDHHPFEHHILPEPGFEVFYRDKDHTYFEKVNPKFQGAGAKKGVVAYTGVQEAQVGSPSGIGGHAESGIPDPLADWIAERGPNWREDRDRKGDVGTFTHAVVECRLRNDEEAEARLFDDWRDSVIEDSKPYLAAVDLFFHDHQFETLHLETVVYSKKHRFAGRFDAALRWVGSVDSPHQRLDTKPLHWSLGDSVLGDAKTSGFIGRKFQHQLHLYDIASEECGYGRWDHLAVFQFCGNGKYRVLPARSSRAAALHSLALYWDGKETDSDMRSDYRELAAA